MILRRNRTYTKCADCIHNLSHIETYDGLVQDQCGLNTNLGEFHTKIIRRCSNYEGKGSRENLRRRIAALLRDDRRSNQ